MAIRFRETRIVLDLDSVQGKTLDPPEPAEASIGKKYHRLRVLRILPEHTEHGNVYVECLCQCGSLCVTRMASIRDGSTKSCGCASKARWRRYGQTPPTLGLFPPTTLRPSEVSAMRYEIDAELESRINERVSG